MSAAVYGSRLAPDEVAEDATESHAGWRKRWGQSVSAARKSQGDAPVSRRDQSIPPDEVAEDETESPQDGENDGDEVFPLREKAKGMRQFRDATKKIIGALPPSSKFKLMVSCCTLNPSTL